MQTISCDTNYFGVFIQQLLDLVPFFSERSCQIVIGRQFIMILREVEIGNAKRLSSVQVCNTIQF